MLIRGMRGRAALVLAAVAAAVIPLPKEFVERWYSTGFYLRAQPVVTWVSNRFPFALLDVLIVGTLVAWALLTIRDGRRGRFAAKLAIRLVTGVAVLYLAFLLMWGLNYRRMSLAGKLQFDSQAVSPESALVLGTTAVDRLNAIHDPAHAMESRDADVALAAGFDRVQRDLGVARTAVPARPKATLLNPFFKLTGVDGMTDPYFLETLLVTDLLPFERPIDTAHEWGHLAGFADESEASFVGWLTCLHGSVADQYGGWLFMFDELGPAMRREDRADLYRRLSSGPLADLRAIAERQQKNVNRAAASASGRIYDRYLKANRVEAGIASYDEVVQLALGVRFGPDWTPRALP